MTGALAIIVAGGSGQRFGRVGGKQVATVAGRPLFVWALEACALAERVSDVVVVAPRERHREYASLAAESGHGEGVQLAASGETRQASVASGLTLLGEHELVVVHDGARPLATSGLVDQTIAALESMPGADGVVVAHPSVDTVKIVRDGVVIDTPDRSTLWAVQTPQVFRAEALLRAYASATADGFAGTDDASLIERIGGSVGVFEGPRDNIKVTLPEDLAYAEVALAERRARG